MKEQYGDQGRNLCVGLGKRASEPSRGDGGHPVEKEKDKVFATGVVERLKRDPLVEDALLHGEQASLA